MDAVPRREPSAGTTSSFTRLMAVGKIIALAGGLTRAARALCWKCPDGSAGRSDRLRPHAPLMR